MQLLGDRRPLRRSTVCAAFVLFLALTLAVSTGLMRIMSPAADALITAVQDRNSAPATAQHRAPQPAETQSGD